MGGAFLCINDFILHKTDASSLGLHVLNYDNAKAIEVIICHVSLIK